MQSVRALIVDDPSVMRKIVERCLRQAGVHLAEVREANNGTDALDIAAKNSLDLILCDINMPVMDGIELVRGSSTLRARKMFRSSSSAARAESHTFCRRSPRALAATYVNPLLLTKLKNTWYRCSWHWHWRNELWIPPFLITTCVGKCPSNSRKSKGENP